jgi:UDP-N-acetylmuramoylalanine--D-glutamate ligase
LEKHKNKIITDLDLFYINNPNLRSIVVTGTNGKSTTCKLIEHLLKKSGRNVKLGGNIGKPVLTFKYSDNSIFVIEASSFQLAHSKFIKPNYAILLNISNDHLDWHGSYKNYINSKLKIFSLQKKKDFSLIKDKKFLNFYNKKKLGGKLKLITSKKYTIIKNKIRNNYLKSEANFENMIFVYEISILFKIKKFFFIKYMNSFKGLEHRQEIFLKKKNVLFINDSKATSFEATKLVLKSYKNILWIIGGIPKKNDRIKLNNIKKNISKCFIIGNHIVHFKKQLINKVKFSVSKTLDKAISDIFKEIKKMKGQSIVLFSPTGSSFDQYKNFVERGNQFKKIVRLHANKF